ncbi:hypothetical protein [Rhizobium sp. RCAM05973]|uniref:hypothetical protein n=1 Tax=Rhizobium sp. RCAM05973 TaxID=2994066 RepID=UPI0022EBDF70|nr:hypothetical protein [Rhizobium sp. RCAM05973]
MSTGDDDDMIARGKAIVPAGWFPSSSPILDGVLSGFANVASWIYGLIVYAKAQTRILTATDGWLDLIAFDFFGRRMQRGSRTDASFRTAIIAELFRPRNTRQAIIDVLTGLTGNVPDIFEPARPQDTGGYAPGPAGDGRGYGLAYNLAGGYGSLLMPYEILITAHRSPNGGIPNVIGYGGPAGGYSTPSTFEYGNLDMIQGTVTDAAIYSAVDNVRAAAITAWVRIDDGQAGPPSGYTFLFGNTGSALIRLTGQVPGMGYTYLYGKL